MKTVPATKILTGTAVVDDMSADRLRELQRLAELGRLSASLLHEISNPLAAAILHLEQLEDQQSVNVRHARRNIQMLQHYVEAARQQVRQESQPVNFYVRPQLGQIKRVLLPLARRNRVKLCIETSANHRLFGDPVKFQQIIANLVVNAIDAYRDQPIYVGTERLVRVVLTNRQQWVIVKVVDQGGGIAAEQLPKLFDPFYTTKGQSGHGLGIGLTMVKRYVESDFSGSISVASSARRGTKFTAKLRLTPRYRRLPPTC